ncbi:golgin subfamily A member 2-like isoform X2 [Sorex fumeus]|uniref:golgin subfamily A member 2-like isoform X2 n=1 Tax=Sorex fumeus TaxID=62283 RepID=UPI0024AE7D1D|nr:golgin subfamily A member 2-like isoform X2 [Sorex fumeus]
MEETRKMKLASARKMLRDYEIKHNIIPGKNGKKKKKCRDGDQDGTAGEGHQLPKGEPQDQAPQQPSPDDSQSPSVPSSPARDSSTASASSLGTQNGQSEPRASDAGPLGGLTSSTESLRQLSQKLNGLVSEPSPCLKGQGVMSPTSLKTLESRYQEISLALDQSNVEKKDLTNKILELQHQHQCTVAQLEKEKKEFEQKLAKEQGSLREQLQVHIQTIGILVSEKSDLYTALTHTQQAMKQKTGECEDVTKNLHASRQRVGDLERTLSALATRQKQDEKHAKELTKERDDLKTELFQKNKSVAELKDLVSELREKLRVSQAETDVTQQSVADLQKKLEMTELLLLQFTGPTEGPGSDPQAVEALGERKQMEREIEELKRLLKQLQVERDQHLEQIRAQDEFWQQRVQQALQQSTTFKDENEKNVRYIQELEASMADLKARLETPAPQEPPPPPPGPSELEVQLQAEAEKWRKEVASLAEQLQTQVRDNQSLSQLNAEQGQRLLQLEREAEVWNEQAEARGRILETMENDRTTITRALAQNRELKQQLAELQDGFVKLSNENMEVTCALQSEQHVKEQLAERLGQLQEKLAEMKETVQARASEAQALQQQRDQYLGHLQQYAAAWQQLGAEKEQLQQQALLHAQQLDRLQHEHAQGQDALDEAQGLLKATEEQKQQLQAQLSALLAPGTGMASDGDGDEEQETAPRTLSLPGDLDDREAMLEFCNSALAQADSERAELRRQLGAERVRSRELAQALAAAQPAAPAPGAQTVPQETHAALKEAMDLLQTRFAQIMQEKVELRERVEELEHRCVQLSGETETIGEYITLYHNQRAVLKERHREKEEYITRLAQDKENLKVQLLELQELVLMLVDDSYSGQGAKAASVALAGSLASAPTEAPHAGSPGSVELNPEGAPAGPAPVSNPTAVKIIQLLKEMQNCKDQPGLGAAPCSPCIPFFYKADENDQVKITMI